MLATSRIFAVITACAVLQASFAPAAGPPPLVKFMLDYGSGAGDEAEAAANWLEYFKQLQDKGKGGGQVDEMVDWLQNLVDHHAESAPPPPRPPSSVPSARTADIRAPSSRMSSPRSTVDLAPPEPPPSRTPPREPVPDSGTSRAAREGAEEFAEGGLKRFARKGMQAAAGLGTLYDLYEVGSQAVDGVRYGMAAQEAFNNEQDAEAIRQANIQNRLDDLRRDYTAQPSRFNDSYSLEELENLMRINLDQHANPYDGLQEPLSAEEPPPVEEPAPLPMEPLWEPSEPAPQSSSSAGSGPTSFAPRGLGALRERLQARRSNAASGHRPHAPRRSSLGSHWKSLRQGGPPRRASGVKSMLAKRKHGHSARKFPLRAHGQKHGFKNRSPHARKAGQHRGSRFSSGRHAGSGQHRGRQMKSGHHGGRQMGSHRQHGRQVASGNRSHARPMTPMVKTNHRSPPQRSMRQSSGNRGRSMASGARGNTGRRR